MTTEEATKTESHRKTHRQDRSGPRVAGLAADVAGAVGGVPAGVINELPVLYHVSERSANAKTGRMLVTTTSRSSCPERCPLRDDSGNGACYALGGYLSLHWEAVGVPKGEARTLTTDTGQRIIRGRGLSLDDFVRRLETADPSLRARHNQAGDLPSLNGYLEHDAIRRIADAFSRFHSAWTYTHLDPNHGDNAEILRQATAAGLTCNLSADSPQQADRYSRSRLPVVLTVDEQHPLRSRTPEGRRIVVCPEQTGRTESCTTCPRNGLCSIPDRDYIIGFRAHGRGRRRIGARSPDGPAARTKGRP